MTNMFWFAGGLLGLSVALVHASIGQRLIVAPTEGLSEVRARVLTGVFHLSSVYWFALGAAVAIAGVMQPGVWQRPVAWVTLLIYATGATANFWATRGRHFGWVALAVSVLLIGWGLADV
ncbi:MAG: hypothetical protein AAGL69_11740 [Pseudomonadota bacterium]